ncbi:MAG: AAA family ATPase [Calditrichaceae bacterium]|nr:AAA family ATPase [Calditrichia bacterium]NUQ41712.1 AAA family ATPase [Calditrichaceae bacterium]
MLKHIYIDNYRCLVNFELDLNSINLFLGANGSGKSTVFEVLHKIQAFASGNEKVAVLFGREDCTRWQNILLQNFELEIAGNGGTYKYELTVEHEQDSHRARVKRERLWFNKAALLEFEMGMAQLYHDDHKKGPQYPFDWTQSAVATIQPRKDNKKLTWFKERLSRLMIVQLNPFTVSKDSKQEEKRPSRSMDNYVSWFRHLSQEYQGRIFELTGDLRKILDGFDSFRLAEAGEEYRTLRLLFSGSRNGKDEVEYGFQELSEGQRALIILYTLIYCTRDLEFTLCIDEPENFLVLPEIQPWLVSLYDHCNEGRLQALLISHHPEFIDYLASTAGYWFDRQEGSGPVRVSRIQEDEKGGVAISELIARGWLHE